MFAAIQSVVLGGLGLMYYPLFAQEPTKSGGTPPAKGREPSFIAEFFKSLDWWIWALVVALIVLIIVLIIVRKKQAED
jgi:hypothetical protein